MNYIVIDLEFNQAFEFGRGIKTERLDSCPFEIIQIGIVKLNEECEFIDSANFFVKPQIYPRIHPYVEKITGLTAEMFKDKSSFPEIYDEMVGFIGPGEYIFGIWGSHDIKLLFKNITHYGINEDKISKDYVNIQSLASRQLKKPNGMSIGLQNAVESFNLEIDIPFHDALNDAIYTAKIFKIVNRGEMVIQRYVSEGLEKTRPVETISVSRLFRAVEREYGRKLSKKEKKVFKKVYLMGRSGQFDLKGPDV